MGELVDEGVVLGAVAAAAVMDDPSVVSRLVWKVGARGLSEA